MITNFFVQRLLGKNQAVRNVAIISSCTLLSSLLELINDLCIQRKEAGDGNDEADTTSTSYTNKDEIEDEEKIMNMLDELVNVLLEIHRHFFMNLLLQMILLT